MSKGHELLGITATIMLNALSIMASPEPAHTGPQELTLAAVAHATQISDLEFSPDGRSIACVSNQTGVPKIWLVPSSGGEPSMLLAGTAPESSPQWSPDGKQIAFLAGTEAQIFVAPASGGQPTRLTDDKSRKHGIRWSPDGSRIAFISDAAKDQDIYVAEVSTRKIRQITHKTNEWDEVRWAPAWSPDGKQIAYVSAHGEYYADELWVVSADGSDAEKVTSKIQVMTDPIWSPDGKYIAFNAGGRTEFWFDDISDIYLVEMPQRRLRKLEMDSYVTNWNGFFHMYWATDSRTLYYRYNLRGDTNIWAVSIDGNGVATQITDRPGAIQSMAVSPKGDRIAFVRGTQTSPGEVATISTQGGEETVLTRWATQLKDVSDPERISFRTRDGLYINGYLYKPPRMAPGEKYPGLVQVHGGGNNAYGNGFHGLEQYFAKKGYIVLAIEYRGSSGYGRAFQLSSWGKWASDQGWDAVAAAETLRSLDYCSGKIGIYGGSYGGIMTLAALTRDSSKFQAAAPFYGIYDWTTAFRDGDRLMRFWITMGMKGFKPDENPQIYRENSTINFIQNVTTPMLIEHGKLDRRAPYGQSVELVNKLKQQNKVVEFFDYDNEEHGIRQPDNFVDAYSRLEAWFAKYLR